MSRTHAWVDERANLELLVPITIKVGYEKSVTPTIYTINDASSVPL
ncbi:MAG: hypothetical protein HYR56_07920 [Acidobacteria bacterium]|nr:hypothetical protein [Acidobacteriota bacterium]MBI3426156.1 hypothetical protein [Acidobacteriota bacterium]